MLVNTSRNMFDVAVVGAGPIGIELAAALSKEGISYVHFEAKQIGATINWWPPQTRWFSSNQRISIAGVPLTSPDQSKSTREQYLAYLRSVVEQFDLQVRTYEPVVSISKEQDAFAIRSISRGGEVTTFARKVVLATGGTDEPRRLGVVGEDLPHVHTLLREPHDYFKQSLVIVGGKNSAVESALRAQQAGAKVTLVHRNEAVPEKHIKYWLMPEFAGLVKGGKIQACFSSKVVLIEPDCVWIESLIDGNRRSIPADFVLKQIGFEHDAKLLAAAGVELVGTDRVPKFDPQTLETNVAGLYVAGTTVGGTQRSFSVFLENCHIHVDRILAHLTNSRVRLESPIYANIES